MTDGYSKTFETWFKGSIFFSKQQGHSDFS